MNRLVKYGGHKMYRLGVIGYGGMGSYHVSELKSYKKIHIQGIFDMDPSRMEEAKKKGYETYATKEAMMNDPLVDIILIATTNEVHKELAIEALRAGKHVICEKPVTMNSKELEEIMVIAKETGKLFTIDQNRRTNKDFVLMKRSVEAGLLGDVYVIESRVEGSRGMPSGWRTIKALGGGMMLDWGVHLIDQLLYMIQEPVKYVFCKMYSIDYKDVDDNFRLTMTFESGLTAHIEVSTNNFITHPRWYVLGQQGTLQIDTWDCDGKIVRCKDKESVWEHEIVYTKAGPTKTMAARRQDTIEEIALSEPLDVVDQLSVVYDGFIGAIEGKHELPITAEQAMKVMKVMEAAFESSEMNCVVTL